MSTRLSPHARHSEQAGPVSPSPEGIVVRFVTESSNHGQVPPGHWSSWSAWPGHPAVMSPLPRLAKSSGQFASAAPHVATGAPRVPIPAAPSRTAHGGPPHHAKGQVAAPARHTHNERPAPKVHPVEPMAWPQSFDDWMMDIVRRRALRLNSGARRRGVTGSVRAVELAHILDRSADSLGRWICAICREPVTLADLSFDHVIALADGGEHAAHNLVPAHRKCNEIKGSEKAQYRVQALDRWLAEWASSHSGAVPRGVTRHPARPGIAAMEPHALP